MTNLAVIDQPRNLTAVEVRGHVQLVQQVMQAVMKKGTHYDVIPGTGDKPSLLKPGAEVLMSTFRIAVDPQVEDLSSSDEIRYRVRCVGTHQTTGIVMGTGVGECSSNEEKYKWKRTSKREFDATSEDRRRIKFGYDKGKRQEYEVQQIRTEPADVANTILKMAKKRALVDFTLTALAASDIFAQDLEDMPEGLEANEADKPRTVAQPKAKEAPKAEPIDPNKKLSAGQLKMIRTSMGRVEGLQEADVCKQFEAATLEDISFGRVNEVLKFITDKTPE